MSNGARAIFPVRAMIFIWFQRLPWRVSSRDKPRLRDAVSPMRFF
jgi:hypothetical protein